MDAGNRFRPLGLLIVGLSIGLVVGVAVTVTARVGAPAPIVIMPAPTPPEPTPPAAWRVYVSGAVVEPGVYEVPFQAIVEDAVLAAGGFAETASLGAVNLAQALGDGDHVRVPAAGEASSPVTGEAPVVGASVMSSLVNLNEASVADLQSLPGIGPSTAANIVTYRESNGPFVAIEAIMDVPGIGPAKFDQIADLITVE